MSKLIDLTGEKFERLTVLGRVDNGRRGEPMWLCVCDCGTEKIIFGNNLRRGTTRSCGCLQKDKVTKHGYSKRRKGSGIYRSWDAMIQRCTNPNNNRYSIYGYRNITVCKEWKKFENFLDDMGEPPTDQHQIDRIDNSKGYCKTNCRWVTPKRQQRNRRNNRIITYDGKTQCLIEWAEEFGIGYQVLWDRLYRCDWPIKKALTTPVRKRRK